MNIVEWIAVALFLAAVVGVACLLVHDLFGKR